MILAALLLAAAPAAAASATATTDEQRRLAMASRLGVMIYAFDRLGARSTDAVHAKLPPERMAELRGWAIERGKDDLAVTFYGMADAKPYAIARVATRSGTITATEIIPAGRREPLSPIGRRIADAQATARGLPHRPCTDRPFNTVTVPPERPDGPTIVYLLTPQTRPDELPAGGHFRVALDGRKVVARPFTRTCLPLSLVPLPAGGRPASLTVSHVLDPVPTELHVYLSLLAQLPVYVVTADRRRWLVKGNSISLAAPSP